MPAAALCHCAAFADVHPCLSPPSPATISPLLGPRLAHSRWWFWDPHLACVLPLAGPAGSAHNRCSNLAPSRPQSWHPPRADFSLSPCLPQVLPSWLTTVTLCLLLVFVTHKMLQKALDIRSKERRALRESLQRLSAVDAGMCACWCACCCISRVCLLKPSKAQGALRV